MVGSVRAAARQWGAWGISAIAVIGFGCAYGFGFALLADYPLGMVTNTILAALIVAYLIPARVAARKAVSP